jgi:hypothetical protein
MPSSVIVPQEYLLDNDVDQRSLVESVADSIAASLGVPKLTQYLTQLWDTDKPDAKGHMPLPTYLEEVM